MSQICSLSPFLSLSLLFCTIVLVSAAVRMHDLNCGSLSAVFRTIENHRMQHTINNNQMNETATEKKTINNGRQRQQQQSVYTAIIIHKWNGRVKLIDEKGIRLSSAHTSLELSTHTEDREAHTHLPLSITVRNGKTREQITIIKNAVRRTKQKQKYTSNLLRRILSSYSKGKSEMIKI